MRMSSERKKLFRQTIRRICLDHLRWHKLRLKYQGRKTKKNETSCVFTHRSQRRLTLGFFITKN